MIKICAMFPRYLTSFQFEFKDLTDDNIKRLTLDPSNPAQDLAPDLSCIALTDVPTQYEPLAHLWSAVVVEMILSRWARNPHTKIKLSMRYMGEDPRLDPRIIKQLLRYPGSLQITNMW